MTALRVFLVWLLLLVLVAAELLLSRLTAGAALVPGIGLIMAAIVATAFMRLGRENGLPTIFALAGVFWLLVLMGLGGLDPLTRHDVVALHPGLG